MAIFVDLVLRGDAGDNFLRGEQGADRIVGNDGNDVLSGGSGNDLVMGGRGSDYMHGGNGSDVMYGGMDSDVLLGGSGTDYLSGDGGADYMHGGNGADIFAFNVAGGLLGNGVDRIADFVVGQDKLAIVGGSAANVSFVDEGSSLGVFYDGIKIASMTNVGAIPADTSIFF